MKKKNLIFIHGLGVSENQKELMLGNIDQRKFNIYTIGLPGSPKVRYQRLLSLTAYTKWLKLRLEELKLEKYILIGNSFGGLIVNKYAETQFDPKLDKVIDWAVPFRGVFDYIITSYDFFLAVKGNHNVIGVVRMIVSNLEKYGISLTTQDLLDLTDSDPRYMLNGIKTIQKKTKKLRESKVERLVLADPYDMYIPKNVIGWLETETHFYENTELAIINHSGHMGNAEGREKACKKFEDFCL